MRRYRSILSRIEYLAAQQRRQTEMNDLEQLAETTRARILQYLQAHRDGSPLPVLKRAADCGSHSIPEAHGARERLRARLAETGKRLEHYAQLREQYGIE